MRQTAVQFLGTKLMYLNMNPKEIRDFLEWYEKAKQMEKEQIEDAFTEGCFTESWDLKSSEQYYIENYENES